ncbi:MAG: hypothetical protein LBS50_03170, partial [Prevotellaceae bacterium]|nr:hypothetical protein [Prevotellaceae bacterium]
LNLCEEAAYTDAERIAYDKYWDEVRRENMLVEGKFAEGVEKGFEKGIEKGIEKGFEKGIEKGIEKVAINMLNENIPVETISKFTGLSISELQTLK